MREYPGYDIRLYQSLENVEYPFISFTLWSIQTLCVITCYGPI